jgi:hypothetical protein
MELQPGSGGAAGVARGHSDGVAALPQCGGHGGRAGAGPGWQVRGVTERVRERARWVLRSLGGLTRGN